MRASERIDPQPEDLDGVSAEAALQALADRVGAHAHARMVYGEPVERDGITVVPVANVRWGFGMGSGYRHAPMRTGGGGAVASPAGYLEIRDGACRYVALESRRRPLVAIAAMIMSILGRKLTKRRRR